MFVPTKLKCQRNYIAILLVAYLCVACGSGSSESNSNPQQNNVPVSTETSPDQRSFYLGMVPWPYDLTVEAVDYTYKIINQHCDLVAFHFDGGVPWPEALADKPYDIEAENDVAYKASRITPNQKVYLAITPIGEFSNRRSGLADYWGVKSNLPLPDEWADKEFDDPEVITAYTNHALNMIKKLNPESKTYGVRYPNYMAYGIEVNMLAAANPAAFEKYLILVQKSYDAIKAEHPNLPLFLTLEVETFIRDIENQSTAINKLLPYTDYIALSSYPYMLHENPKNIPSNWFNAIRDLAPEKPFAIAETTFLAEDLHIEKYSIAVEGNQQWQKDYVDLLMRQANELDAEFVVWFVPRDYDLGWVKMEAMGLDEAHKAWKDTGLYDEIGQLRPGLKVWDSWKNRVKAK